MEYKFYDQAGSMVVIGQSCNIGNRLKYTAVSCKTRKFAHLYPEDFCIFLGHSIDEMVDPNYPGGRSCYYEVAIVERIGEVKLAVGVLEPLEVGETGE